jgi:hypothetical protein
VSSPGARDASYVNTLKDTVDRPFQTPWWYAMTAAAAIAVLGFVTRSTVTLAVGLVTGGFFIAFWIFVGTLEHTRCRRKDRRSARA